MKKNIHTRAFSTHFIIKSYKLALIIFLVIKNILKQSINIRV